MASTTNTDASVMAVDAPAETVGNRLFARLPVELMVMIARPLPTPDLCAFRASCKAVEAALFPSFRHEFFRKKQFMVEDGSLRALLAISRHARLASALAHVVIGLDHVDNDYMPEHALDALKARRLAYAQHSLLCSGRAVALLAAAFRNLARHGNPTTVDVRDFDSGTRWRDGPRAAWHSYGAKAHPSIVSPAGRPVNETGENRRFSFASGVFVVLLRALAAARVCPASLEVLFRNKFGGLGDFAFDLTELADDDDDDDELSGETDGAGLAKRQRPSVLHVLRGLEKLHLDVHLAADRYSGHTNGFESDEFANVDYANTLHMQLHQFLAAASNVRWLRLNFQRSDPDLIDDFLKLFGRSAADLDLALGLQQDYYMAPPERLLPYLSPSLERLDLGQGWMNPENLLRAVQRIPTLKALHLYVITFHNRRQGQPPEQSRWPCFLEALAAATAPAEDGGTAATPLAHLRDFSVTNAAQQQTNGRMGPVLFDGKEYASYKGPRLSDFLRNLSGSVVPPPPDSRLAPTVLEENTLVDGGEIDYDSNESSEDL